MKYLNSIRFTSGLIFLISISAFGQSRIRYNNQDLFLSGANLAWESFANDIGPGQSDFNSIGEALLQMHDNGGNVMRWWLHTNGTNSPEYNDSGLVISPGESTIDDIKAVLDLAWDREIGIILCLWSFDMLRSSNNAEVLERNRLVLTDTSFTNSYINNSLIPMVDSLKEHPAILSWEIFNEPEGMSNEFGWSEIQHVPMSAIQRFINLTSGAIHRTDTSALVTSGAWSFLALTDIIAKPLATQGNLSNLTSAQKEEITAEFNYRYRLTLTSDQVIAYIEKISNVAAFNYYSDERLIAAGGDPDGFLDFYSVHYYPGIRPSNPTSISPFHYPNYYWGLNKPLVIAEFPMQNISGIPKENLFDTLYQNGYAGALPWSWSDINISSRTDMLAGMKFMWDNYRSDVDVNGISGEWPSVTLITPEDEAEFPDSSDITIEAEASDNDGSVVLVEFFANDTLKIGETDTIPYSVIWLDVPNDSYTLSAVATDNNGNKRKSNVIEIQVGIPQYAKLEAESTPRSGSGMSVVSDQLASNGAVLRMQTQVGTITWTLPNVPVSGSYNVKFRFRLPFDTPKNQFLNINGTRFTEVEFSGSLNTFMEKDLTIDLIQGSNTVQMELSWGWMDLDYFAVPPAIVTSVEEPDEIPLSYSLSQNYPNPFNPTTTINFTVPNVETSHASSLQRVNLIVYDVLGKEVAVLVNEEKPAGTYTINFDGTGLASGVYFYRLILNNFVSSKKMILLK